MIFSKLIPSNPRTMDLRRAHAIIIAFTQHIDIARPNHGPKDVWLCTFNTKIPLCSLTRKVISEKSRYGDMQTCVECDKTYFECLTCKHHRKDQPGCDYSKNCEICSKYMMVCHECVQESYIKKSQCIVNAYECCVCGTVICSACDEKAIHGVCELCGVEVKLCSERHALLGMRCTSCGYLMTM
jgi:hypothetical protein